MHRAAIPDLWTSLTKVNAFVGLLKSFVETGSASLIRTWNGAHVSCLAVKRPPARSTDPDPLLSWKRLAVAVRANARTLAPDDEADLLRFADLLEGLAELETSQAAAASVSALALSNRSI